MKNDFVFSSATAINTDDILLAKKGNDEAWDRIVSFLLPKAKAHAFMLCPAKASSFQECDIQSSFFSAIENAVTSFRPGNKRFENYFLTVYKHELLKLITENAIREQQCALSIDDTIPNSDDTLLFADSIGDSREDDKTYIDLEYAAELYKKTINSINDETAVKVADLRRKNMTFQEISDALGITPRVAWQKFQKYVSAMKRAFKVV